MRAHNCYVLSEKPPKFYENLLHNNGVLNFRVYGGSLLIGYRLLSVSDDEWAKAREVLKPYLLDEEKG